MEEVTIQDALDYCLANPDSLSVPELLGRFPEHQAELEPLLTLGISLQNVSPPAMPLERRDAMKQRLMQAAVARQMTQALPTQPALEPVLRTARKAWSIPWLSRRPVWVTSAVAFLFVLLVWSASANSLPDSPFYNVRLSAENVLADLHTGVVDQARQHLDLANARLFELRTMNSRGKLSEAALTFGNFQYHLNKFMDLWTKTIDGDHTTLARLLYSTSVASQRIINGFSVSGLPAPVQAEVSQLSRSTGEINTSSAQVLQSAGIDLSTVPTLDVPLVTLATATPVVLAQLTSSPGIGGLNASPSATPAPSGSNGNADGTPTSIIVDRATSTSLVVSGGPATVVTALSSTATSLVTPSGGQSTTLPASHTPTLTSLPRPFPSNTATVAVAPPAITHTPVAPAISPTAVPPTHTPALVPVSSATATSSVSTFFTPTPSQVTSPSPSPTKTISPLPTKTVLPPPLPTDPPPLPTSRPTPRPTATESVVSVYDLDVKGVDASCSSNTCVAWSARVSSAGDANISVSWTAELQIKQGNGSYHTVTEQRGSSRLAPGDSTVEGEVCFSFPSDTKDVKIVFSIDRGGSQCSPQRGSERIDPCGEATSTPKVEPKPKPTHGRPFLLALAP